MEKNIESMGQFKNLQRVKLEGLYFDFFKGDDLLGTGIFRCYDPINKNFTADVNELVVGQHFCLGFYGYKTEEIKEIKYLKSTEQEITIFETTANEFFKIVTKIRPDSTT